MLDNGRAGLMEEHHGPQLLHRRPKRVKTAVVQSHPVDMIANGDPEKPCRVHRLRTVTSMAAGTSWRGTDASPRYLSGYASIISLRAALQS